MNIINHNKNLLLNLTDNEHSKLLVKNEIKAILESNQKEYQKSDLIAGMFIDLDEKIAYVKEKISILNNIKKELEKYREKGKEVVAECFSEYGIERLNGLEISSITLTPAKEEIKEKVIIKDEESLIKLGYAKVDEKKVKEALYTDSYNEIEPFIDVEIETVIKPSTIRINKRKSKFVE